VSHVSIHPPPKESRKRRKDETFEEKKARKEATKKEKRDRKRLKKEMKQKFGAEVQKQQRINANSTKGYSIIKF
jgi:hypothetical protein